MKRQAKGHDKYSEEAMATVTACHYEFGAGQALAFGVPKSKRFQISFNYWANGELHTGEFASAKAVPQGTLFPIRYNPDAPQQHDRSSENDKSRLIVGVVLVSAFVLLTLSILARGCAR